MVTPSMIMLAGLATVVYGVYTGDGTLVGLGIVLTIAGGFLWWRKD